MTRSRARWFRIGTVGLLIGAGTLLGLWYQERAVARLPDGGWIGKPRAFEAAVVPMGTPSKEGGQVYEPYEAIGTEPPTLSLRVFEKLPPAKQKPSPSAPARPESWQHAGWTDRVLVFRFAQGKDEELFPRLWFAIADSDGTIGDLDEYLGLVSTSKRRITSDACLPRRSRELKLLVYALPEVGEVGLDPSIAPIASSKFPNPLYNVPAVRKWPDHKVEPVASWNGIEFQLVRAIRHVGAVDLDSYAVEIEFDVRVNGPHRTFTCAGSWWRIAAATLGAASPISPRDGYGLGFRLAFSGRKTRTSK